VWRVGVCVCGVCVRAQRAPNIAGCVKNLSNEFEVFVCSF